MTDQHQGPGLTLCGRPLSLTAKYGFAGTKNLRQYVIQRSLAPVSGGGGGTKGHAGHDVREV